MINNKSSIFWTNFIFIGSLALGIIIIFFVNYSNWSIPVLSFFIRNSSSGNNRIEYYKFFGLMISGWLLLWQAILAGIRTEQGNKNIEISNRNVEIANENVKIGNKNIELQLNNAIEERFKNAITLIGNKNSATKMGAIYALDHIAKDTYNKEKSYTKTIFQILCSYLRETTNNNYYKKKFKDKPSVEIQTIIDLLFKSHKNNFIGYTLLQSDLSYSYLCGANFSEAHCINANFSEAHCIGANFSKAHCEKANFENAHCEKANFRTTNCEEANFCYAHCEEANFCYAHCNGAYFKDANCQIAVFFEAHCEGAKFINTNCEGAIFRYAHCDGADFWDAHCDGADFEYAKKLNLHGSIGTPKNML